MPKYEGGGYNKDKKRGYRKQEIITNIDNEQMYGQVTKNEGNHMVVLCSDNISRLGRLNNRTKKGPRIAVGTYVVISLRKAQTDQSHCDILGVGLPSNKMIEVTNKKNNDDNFEFIDDGDENFGDFEDSKRTNEENNIDFDDIDNKNSIVNKNDIKSKDEKKDEKKDDDDINFDDL